MAAAERRKVKATLTGTTTILCAAVPEYERGQMQSRWEIKEAVKQSNYT